MRIRRLRLPAAAEQPPAEGQIVALELSQAHHALRVLRLRNGSRVELVSPWGLAPGLVESASLSPVPVLLVRLIGPFETASEYHGGLELALALIRGPRFDWAVEKAAELGASSLTPLLTERARPENPGLSKRDRWRRLSEEARKQCGRALPMEINEPQDLSSYLAGTGGRLKLLLDPAGPPLWLTEEFRSLAAGDRAPAETEPRAERQPEPPDNETQNIPSGSDGFPGPQNQETSSGQTQYRLSSQPAPPPLLAGADGAARPAQAEHPNLSAPAKRYGFSGRRETPVQDPAQTLLSVSLLIGPEGGLTQAELSAAQLSGFKPVSVGSNILRTETAALAALSILLCLRQSPAA